MKKFSLLILALSFCISTLQVYAIEESPEYLKAQAKYQKKLEKIKRKQEIKCIKNPEFCSATNTQQQNLTLGIAQKNIKVGTTQDEVAMALGSPNIVTTDADGKETWIYDKVASVSSYSNSGFSVGIILAGYSKGKEANQTTQKTLTIVIKFNNKKVESFKYHMSSF